MRSTQTIKLALIGLFLVGLIALFVVLVSLSDSDDEAVTNTTTASSTTDVLSPETPWLGEWVLVHGEVDDGKVFFTNPTGERGMAPQINLAADLSITGTAVCNTFFGRYDDGAVNTLSWTKKGCTISSISEADFFAALSKVNGLALDDQWMRWSGNGATLEFVRPESGLGASPVTDENYKDN